MASVVSQKPVLVFNELCRWPDQTTEDAGDAVTEPDGSRMAVKTDV